MQQFTRGIRHMIHVYTHTKMMCGRWKAIFMQFLAVCHVVSKEHLRHSWDEGSNAIAGSNTVYNDYVQIWNCLNNTLFNDIDI
jgi:hypothetical protein